jgi:hypothetical protein
MEMYTAVMVTLIWFCVAGMLAMMIGERMEP